MHTHRDMWMARKGVAHVVGQRANVAIFDRFADARKPLFYANPLPGTSNKLFARLSPFIGT